MPTTLLPSPPLLTIAPAGGSPPPPAPPDAALVVDPTGCTVRLAMPGADRESCRVIVFDGGIICRNTPSVATDPVPGIVHRRERPGGVLRRMVRIPSNLDRDRVVTTVSDGVMEVRLPWITAAPRAVPGPFPAVRAAGRIPIDLHETGSRLILIADVPGVGAGGVSITAHHGVVDLLVDFPQREPTGGTCIWNELPTGPVARRIALPGMGEPAWVASELRDGVLRVELGKTDINHGMGAA